METRKSHMELNPVSKEDGLSLEFSYWPKTSTVSSLFCLSGSLNPARTLKIALLIKSLFYKYYRYDIEKMIRIAFVFGGSGVFQHFNCLFVVVFLLPSSDLWFALNVATFWSLTFSGPPPPKIFIPFKHFTRDISCEFQTLTGWFVRFHKKFKIETLLVSLFNSRTLYVKL